MSTETLPTITQTPPKNKGGRPSKAQIAAREGGTAWAKLMLDEYQQGASDVEVCAALKLSEKEFDTKMRDDDLFSRLVQIGRLQAKAFWYKQSRLGLRDKSFNTVLFIKTMQNRYGWSDKSENVERKPDDQKSEEELKQELDSLMKRLAKAYGADPGMRMFNQLHVSTERSN